MSDKYPFGYQFFERLQAAGLIGPGVQRVVIDCEQDRYPVMYVQHVVKKEVLDALLETPGLQVKVVDDPS